MCIRDRVRADKMVDAEEVLHGILSGRRRVATQGTLRELREQLSQALRSGDAESAKRLQEQVMALMRRDRPRGDDDGAPKQASAGPARPLPSFLDPDNGRQAGPQPEPQVQPPEPAPDDPSMDESA